MPRRLIVLAIALAACTTPAPRDPASRYLDDAPYRRAAMLASLSGSSRYVVERQLHYATGDELDWDRREPWNPPTRALGSTDAYAALDLSLPPEELGRRAFTRYPAQLAPRSARALTNAALVEVEVGDGVTEPALTCATCHRDGDRIGAPNRQFDYGALLASEAKDPEFVRVRRSWGAGHVDVSSVAGTEPVMVPDLRPVRYQTHLQYAGAVEQRDLITLAMRVETLIITAHAGALRPPRQIALGLAAYLWSLAPPLRTPPDGDGARVFESRCAKCHEGAHRAGRPRNAAGIGTDIAAAISTARGTGGYRVPSLIGVADRHPLLHDGSVETLSALLDPARPGGHAFTARLSAAEREALRAFVEAL